MQHEGSGPKEGTMIGKKCCVILLPSTALAAVICVKEKNSAVEKGDGCCAKPTCA